MLIKRKRVEFIFKSLAGKTNSSHREEFVSENWGIFATSKNEARNYVNKYIKTYSQSFKNWSNYTVYVKKDSEIVSIYLESRNSFRPSIFSSTYSYINSFIPDFFTNSTTSLPEKYKYLSDEINETFTFGIEIEFQSKINGSAICNKFEFEGLSVENKSSYYGRSSATKWVLCYDNSIHTTSEYRFNLELTTPALKGKAGLIELQKYMTIIQKLASDGDIKVDKSCGLHTHYGSFGNDVNLAEKFQNFYSKNESYFDCIVPKSRREANNTYCQPVRLHSRFDKYQKVTLRAFSQRGTFEIRHHSGTLSFVKMANWIVFNMSIMESLKENMPVERKSTFMDFVSYFTSGKVLEYLVSRKIILNPDPSIQEETC